MATTAQKQAARRIEFGVFEADLTTGELRRSGTRVRLQSQPFRLLAVLLEHSGDVVSRESLQREIWGADTTVDFDHSLGIAVNKLREALGDSADNPRFIETLSKRGYRFIAPTRIVDFPSSFSQVAATGLPRRSAAGVWWLAGLLALVSLVLLSLLFLRPTVRKPYHIVQITFSGHVLANDTSNLDVESFSSSASDGARIYFSSLVNGNPVLAVALAANGEIGTFHLPSEIGAPLIGSLSPDGSQLVVRSHLQAEPEQPLWVVPTLGGEAHRVPNVLAHDATWMPDGRHLLVASKNKLVIVGTDGSNPHTLLTTAGLAFWMRWSPRGRRLRFTLRDPAKQTSELWEVSAGGRNPHPLLPGWSQPASECCGSWTSDGQYFVFQSSHSGNNEIWALRERPWYLASRQPRQITNGPLDFEAPSTAPGTHRIFFIGATDQYELFRAIPHSAAFTPLSQNLSTAALAEFSRDGRWVAWLNAADSSLWCSRIDGSERIELTTPPLRIFSMEWSPDDRRLALMAKEPDQPWKIYLVDAQGGSLAPLLNEDRNEADPSWSPDGKSIVFGRPPDRMDSDQPKAIYSVSLKTRKVTEIPGSTGLFSPRVSPDGRYIAAMPMNQHALMLFDTASRHWSTLTSHGAGDPTWSHNGRFLYFQDFLEPGKPIYRIAVPQDQLEPVATIENLRPFAATEYRLIGLAPGDLPITSVRTSSVNLYQVDLDGR